MKKGLFGSSLLQNKSPENIKKRALKRAPIKTGFFGSDLLQTRALQTLKKEP